MRLVNRSDESEEVQGCVCRWQDKTGRKEVGRHGSRKDRRAEMKIKVQEVLREMEEVGEKERMKGSRG